MYNKYINRNLRIQFVKNICNYINQIREILVIGMLKIRWSGLWTIIT